MAQHRPYPITLDERQLATHCCRFLHDKGWTAIDPKRSLVAGNGDGEKCP
jgi:hypothetical protein